MIMRHFKYLLILFLIGLISFNCSSKDEQKVQKQQSNQTNELTSKQQNNNSQQTSQQSNILSYTVKEINKDFKKTEMIDFTWVENGAEKKLSEYKGKVILLNFWATWCPPCRKELPDLSAISSELKDKDFKMIGISVDDNQEVLNDFLKKNNLSYTIIFEPSELITLYMTTAGQKDNVVPQTYIIDKKGKVVEAIMGSRSKADFLKIINKYL